jgi:hypothetical protein
MITSERERERERERALTIKIGSRSLFFPGYPYISRLSRAIKKKRLDTGKTYSP